MEYGIHSTTSAAKNSCSKKKFNIYDNTSSDGVLTVIEAMFSMINYLC